MAFLKKNHKLGVQFCFDWNIIVPEIQGTTQEVATEKCRHAAELVREFHLSLFSSPPPFTNHHSQSALCWGYTHTASSSISHFHITFFYSIDPPHTTVVFAKLHFATRTDRRPCHHGRHSAMFHGYERPTRPLHKVFLARARSRGCVFALYTFTY
jgi:hypothetical protein